MFLNHEQTGKIPQLALIWIHLKFTVTKTKSSYRYK